MKKAKKVTNKTFSKEELCDILTEIKYFDNFRDKYLNRRYENINYGKKIGTETFENLFAAADNYKYPNQVEESVFKGWNQVLNDENSTEENLFCTILEIFVWGDVLSGNVKTAISLYKEKKLKYFLKQIMSLLKEKEIPSISKEKFKIIWSSGWTKVYSFLDENIIIYDSRVSAFLNHTLTYETKYTENELNKLKELTAFLFNFKGNGDRERLVDNDKYSFRNSHPSGINGFKANIISSWIVELINEKLELNKEIRDFERAFFMLGFDLKQIKN